MWWVNVATLHREGGAVSAREGWEKEMGHFRVAVCLGFKASLGAQLLKGK